MQPDSSSIRNYSVALLCLALAVCAVVLTLKTSRTLNDVTATTGEVKAMAATTRAYLDKQNETLSSEKNQKALEAGWQTPAVLNGTLRLVNTQTIPRINRGMDELSLLIKELRGTGTALTAIVENLDKTTTGKAGLIPTATALVASINDLTRTELRDAIAQFAAAGKNLVVLTDDPALQAIPGEVSELLKSLGRTGAKVEVIADNMAGVTSNLKLMSDDVQKKTHALLNPPPAPWYKKYILTPLREFGGVIYLLVRIANGLN